MPARNEWLAMIVGALQPALTAAVCAAFALAPQRFPEAFPLWLCTMFIAELPLSLLGGVFSGVLMIEGSALRRVLVYLGVVVGICAISGLGGLAYEPGLAAILGWAVFGHLVRLFFLRPEVPLARARIDAMAQDSVNLIVLAAWGVVLTAFAGGVLATTARDTLARHNIDLEWSDLTWVVVVYFLLRAWSAAYASSAAFARREKGVFDRPWINWLIMNMGRSGSSGAS